MTNPLDDPWSAPRLKTEVIVQAGLRRCSMKGIGAYVLKRGDPDAGALYVRLDHLNGTVELLTRARDADGHLVWRHVIGIGPVPVPDVMERLEKERRIDPDLWIVDVETRDGWNPFDETAG